jgi:hypothetical protein
MNRGALILLLVALVAIVPACRGRKPGATGRPGETFLADYEKKTPGGFSQRWVAYIREKKVRLSNRTEYFVELNGQRLGPYSSLSRAFEVNEDGEHIAFAAEKQGKWVVVVDGQEKWWHGSLGWADYRIYPFLGADLVSVLVGGLSAAPERAAILQFSPNGKQLAYVIDFGEDRRTVAVNGVPGPEFQGYSVPLSFTPAGLLWVGFDGNRQQTVVLPGKRLGPYDDSGLMHLSSNKQHWGFRAVRDGSSRIIVDGEERFAVARPMKVDIGNTGEAAYSYQVGDRWRVNFAGRDLPGVFDEAALLSVSPDGGHVAFWARRAKKWSVVTDMREYPGFDGYFQHYHQPSEIRVSILWGAGAQHIAYFARKGEDPILVLDGKEVRDGGVMPWASRGNLTDDDNHVVGYETVRRPEFAAEAFVECLASTAAARCIPESSAIISGSLVYVERAGGVQYVVAGAKRAGPFQSVGDLMVSLDKRHFATIVSRQLAANPLEQASDQQVVLDGDLQPYTYTDIERPAFVGTTEFAYLGIRLNRVYRVAHPLGR